MFPALLVNLLCLVITSLLSNWMFKRFKITHPGLQGSILPLIMGIIFLLSAKFLRVGVVIWGQKYSTFVDPDAVLRAWYGWIGIPLILLTLVSLFIYVTKE